jgi:hypothetical protein
MSRRIHFVWLIFLIAAPLSAQDFGFGFGFDDEESSSLSMSIGNSLSVSISGEVSASMVGYLNDFSEGSDHTQLGDIFAGSLSFAASTPIGEGIINLNLQPTESPVSIDEAYLRVYLGGFDITAGMKKLTWGKADSFGPLDVINPLDTSIMFTEMADNTSLMGVKIARPLIHASYRFGQFSKIEGVFVPNFEPYYIDTEGRWAPSQMEMLRNPTIPIPTSIPIPIEPHVNPPTETKPDITMFDYAQAGLRFTTTIGQMDFGVQYYYGRLPQPAAKISLTSFNLDMASFPQSVGVNAGIDVLYKYNPYHQIGFDYAQVLFGFNVRAELAANITEDSNGDDGSVYNSSIAWSLGFDRDVIWGINLNFQLNESIRLMHDKLGSRDISLPSDFSISNFATIEADMRNIISNSLDKVDIEGGSSLTSTRLTAALSKKFLRDELEVRTAFVWGMEDKDCLIMPALIWTKDDLRFAFSGGFFAGDEEGQLGQYWKNSFLKLSLTYTF